MKSSTFGDTHIGSPDRAHDAKGHRAAQPERIADSQDKITNGERAGIAPGCSGKPAGIDFHNGHIRLRISCDDAPFELPSIGQNHFDIHRISHHVMVRDDVAVR
ncbi:MAG: hypothetical protein QM771_00980 [Nitrospira sp.]